MAARTYYGEALAQQRALKDRWSLPWTLHSLGELELIEGQYRQATMHFAESLAGFHHIGSDWMVPDLLACLARAASVQGQSERAARLFGAVEALLERSGIQLHGRDQATFERDLAATHAQLDEASLAAWEAGRALPLEQAIAAALDTHA